MNKIYRVFNKAERAILIIATDTQEAIDISVELKHARKPSNLKVSEITSEYLEFNKELKLSNLKPGQLFKIIESSNNKISNVFDLVKLHSCPDPVSWNTYRRN